METGDVSPAGGETLSPQEWEALTQELAKLPLYEYDQRRMDKAEKLRIRVKTLDEAVAKWRGDNGPTHGRRLSIETPEPWQHPVDLGNVMDDLVKALQRHVIMQPSAYIVVTLWIVHTFSYHKFQHTPRLMALSADKRCGKSTLLELLRSTCLCPVKADSLSAASVFRTIASVDDITLIVDEADTFLVENEELRGVLNSGFEVSGVVIRIAEINGEHTPIQFHTFAPVAIAAIGRMPSTLEDRSIIIRMERKLTGQSIVKLREPGARDALRDIASKLRRWFFDNSQGLNPNPSIPVALNDREGDVSVPLLSIADAAGPAWARQARAALLAVFGARAADEEAHGAGTMLLADIRTAFRENGALRLPSARLAELLGQMEERPWAEWRHGKPMTPPQLARALAPFGIRAAVMRVPGESGTSRAYQRDFFEDAWARYIPVAPDGV